MSNQDVKRPDGLPITGDRAGWMGKAEAYMDQQDRDIKALQEHERQTHETLGAILGSDDTLERVAVRATATITKLREAISEWRTHLIAFTLAADPTELGWKESAGDIAAEMAALIGEDNDEN